MPEETLVRLCSPTLAGLKTGSLVSHRYASAEALRMQMRRLNGLLSGKGLCVLPLRYRGGRALVYLFRPEMLRRDLAEPKAARLLAERGYPWRDARRCVRCLMARLHEGPEFPHEIGLFLGYPPDDVQGFLCGAACKCVGAWKVYSDEQTARRLFAQYQRCTREYCARFAQGVPIERLAASGCPRCRR